MLLLPHHWGVSPAGVCHEWESSDVVSEAERASRLDGQVHDKMKHGVDAMSATGGEANERQEAGEEEKRKS